MLYSRSFKMSRDSAVAQAERGQGMWKAIAIGSLAALVLVIVTTRRGKTWKGVVWAGSNRQDSSNR